MYINVAIGRSFYFNLGRDPQKNSYGHLAYESVEENIEHILTYVTKNDGKNNFVTNMSKAE